MGSTTAIAIASGAVTALQDDIGDDQVILVVCPPHLIEKWKRELVSINPNIVVEHLKRHEEVYHLRGGILQYLQEVPEDDSLWRGECFVFDDRVSVDHHLQPGIAVICDRCGAGLPHADATCTHCAGDTA